MGVCVSIPFAVEIGLGQLARQTREEKERKQEETQARFSIMFDRVNDELDENETRVENLGEVLSKSKTAREDLWEWAITVADSFSFASYNDFHSSGLDKLLPEGLEIHLYQSYLDFNTLLHGAKQAAAAHKHLSTVKSKNDANENLRAFIQKRTEVAQLLDETLDLLAEFRADGMKIIGSY